MSASRDEEDGAPLLGASSAGAAAERHPEKRAKEVHEARRPLLAADADDDDDTERNAAEGNAFANLHHARQSHVPPPTTQSKNEAGRTTAGGHPRPEGPPAPEAQAPLPVAEAAAADSTNSGAGPSSAGLDASACGNPPPDGARCLICLEDYPSSAFGGILRCAHPVCEACLSALWEHTVLIDSEPFPRCPMPACGAYASDAACASLLPPKTLRRLRQLRGLRPARAADGRRMYCDAPGCFEQLPPPPPPPPATPGAPPAPDAPDAHTTTCPACGRTACARCGGKGHPGTPCPEPLICERQARLYRAYAVGRVSPCPRCGVHVTRDGGCDQMTCARCRHTFTFAPFRSATEVVSAAPPVDEAALPPPPPPSAWAAAFSQLFLAAYFMLWGTGLGALAFVTLVDALAHGRQTWGLLFLVPLVAFGVPSFLLGSVRFLYECGRLVRHVGERAERSVYIACCMIALSLVMLSLQAAVGHVAVDLRPWQYIMFFVPFIVCGAALLSIASAHLLLLGSRAAWAAWHGWGVGDSGEGEPEGAVEGEPPAEVAEEERMGEQMV